MNTKEVCRQLNVSPKMLRVYEEQGLISAKRLENNYRDYSLDDLMRIEVIVTLRNLGFSLSEIKSILSYGEKPQNAYLYNFYIQLKAVAGKINELKAVEKKLGDKINRIMEETKDDIGKTGLNRIAELILESGDSHDRTASTYDKFMRDWDFDEMATDYDNRFLKSDPVYQRGLKRMKEVLVPLISRKSVVDIGCGTCNLWKDFPENIDLTAVDFSLPMLLSGKKSIPWARMKWADILNETTGLGKYDVVVATFMLHHIKRPYQKLVIDNMNELCKDGGRIYIMEKSFKDRGTFEDKKQCLLDTNDTDELTIMTSEFALFQNEITAYLKSLNLDVRVEPLEGDICGYYIEKPVAL